MSFRRVQQWATVSRMWWLFDAKCQCPFKTAPVIVKYLEGRHKPIYHPASDNGDHVVIMNTREIAMEGDYWRTWRHYHHTGYPGGFSSPRAYQVHDQDPTEVIRKQIYLTMKGTLRRKPNMARLHLFPDENIPSEILKNVNGHIRQLLPVPKRLEDYSEEERSKFPSMYEPSDDYVLDFSKYRRKVDKKS